MARRRRRRQKRGVVPRTPILGPTGIPDFPIPQMPPAGSYDPALNYQLRSSQRGVIDLLEDLRREGDRARSDFRTERGLERRGFRRNVRDLGQQRRRGMRDINTDLERGLQDVGYRREDIERSFTRDLTDLATARMRGEDDYERTLGNLQREYATLGQQQGENALAQGVSRGGGVEGGQRVREANQGYERQGIDTQHSRFLEDIAQQEGRLGEDHATALSRLLTGEGQLREDVGLARGRLKTDFSTSRRQLGQDYRTGRTLGRRSFRRGAYDRRQRASRAKREYFEYAPTVTEQAYYQARERNPKIRFPRTPAQRRRLGLPRY